MSAFFWVVSQASPGLSIGRGAASAGGLVGGVLGLQRIRDPKLNLFGSSVKIRAWYLDVENQVWPTSANFSSDLVSKTVTLKIRFSV